MGWQDEVEPPANFHRRRAFPPFPMFPGGPRDPLSGIPPVHLDYLNSS